MEKGIELRDRTIGGVEDTMAQVRSTTNKITMSGRDKAKELLQQGQALVIEQLDHVSDAAKAGKIPESISAALMTIPRRKNRPTR